MSRVERCQHYTTALPLEAPAVNPANPLPSTANTTAGGWMQWLAKGAAGLPLRNAPSSWPSRGTLEFREVHMRYKPHLDPVLRGVSFSIAHGEKVGIVGRTGAGKSSLLATLFRIVEPFRGAVLIDGVDVGTLPLWQLRTAVAIIPQVPVLFSGTLRYNIDAGRNSCWGDGVSAGARDDELWAVLDHVGLASHFRRAQGGLDAEIEEGGQNLSVGQRQLVCLARSLISRAPIVVLDEATASCDPATDARIQRVLREEMRERTIVTIAHRLPTVIDYDRIVVMSAGVVQEMGPPATLLADPGSAFSSMVASCGASAAAFLRQEADRAFAAQRSQL